MSDFENLPKASATRRFTMPPNAVWQVLSSLDRLAEWAPGIDGATVTSGEKAGNGAVRRVATAQFGEIEHVVTAWEPDRKFIYETANSGPFLRTLTSYDIDAAGDEGAVVTVTISFELHAGKMEPEQAIAVLTKGLEATLGALELRARLIRQEA